MCKSKRSEIRRIYRTTDGYFSNRPDIKKPRRVAVIDQRRKDGALAVVKIYSAKGKSGSEYIGDLVLHPNKHRSLDRDSIVGRKIFLGVKNGKGQFTPLFSRDFELTDDLLTHREHRIIKKNIGGATRKNKRTAKRTIKKWKRCFK